LTEFDLPPPPHAGEVKIAFTKAAYPYWYADSNDNGRIDPEELKMANKYPAYTPRLLQAVYNYTYAVRDPGGAYHNGRYVLQLLYDSLDSLAASGKAGVSMSGKARPQRRQGRSRPTKQSMIRSNRTDHALLIGVPQIGAAIRDIE